MARKTERKPDQHDRHPRDGKRNPRVKSRDAERRQARRAKLALQGRIR